MVDDMDVVAVLIAVVTFAALVACVELIDRI
jgi:hypothetical protein